MPLHYPFFLRPALQAAGNRRRIALQIASDISTASRPSLSVTGTGKSG